MRSRIAIATFVICLSGVMPAIAQTVSDDVKQLQAAAEKGDARAQIELGLAYEKGEGVPVDKPKALEWYLKAADQGQHMAAFSVGLLLYGSTDKGEDGVKKDLVGAWKWLDIAIAEAPDMERPIYERARDDAAKKMKPEQIADAQKQSQAWLYEFRHRPVHVGGDVEAPVCVKCAEPVYPKALLKTKTPGSVKLAFMVGVDGKVTDLKVTSPPSPFDQSALDAVSKWEYAPPKVKGEPVPILMSMTLSFTAK